MTDALLAAALEARKNAHAPYSKFLVGAALEAEDGRVFTGCNVENATYGLTMCAERVAVFKGISEGAKRFRRVAVAADTDTLTPPCGSCRQILSFPRRHRVAWYLRCSGPSAEPADAVDDPIFR